MSKFITLTKLQNREPALLQTVIDNTCGKLNIALKSFHYEVGYHNLDPSATFGYASSVEMSKQDLIMPFTLHGGNGGSRGVGPTGAMAPQKKPKLYAPPPPKKKKKKKKKGGKRETKQNPTTLRPLLVQLSLAYTFSFY